MRSATKKKLGKDPAYLDYIRSLPCCVCVTLGFLQASVTEAAHSGPRGLSQKCPDREALPLCAHCHREGPFSQHKLGRFFWSHYGLDRDALLAMYQAGYDADRLGVVNPLEVIGVL